MITLAVLYNLTVVVGRAVFWELDNMFPSGWMVVMMGMAMVVVTVVTVLRMVVVMVVKTSLYFLLVVGRAVVRELKT